MDQEPKKNNQIISYQLLRFFIGIIGILLPIIIIAWQWIAGGYLAIARSISASYYVSPCRNILVGVLFVLGFFLLSYRGKVKWEYHVANMGFLFALGVALCPCEYPALIVRILHYASAGFLFAMFAFFSLVLFRTSTKNHRDNPHLRTLDNVYLTTGILLVLCILGLVLAVVFIKDPTFLKKYKPVLYIETLGLWTFGVAWLTRAHVLWADKKEYPKRLAVLRELVRFE